jgi:hypothetical protein
MPSALISPLLVFCAALAAAAGARAEPSYGSEIPPPNVVAQLDQLAPQRPGTVDLYAIVVGGDGMEEVFGREVAQVRRVLEERFDAAGRIVTLVNARNAPEPEATLRSLAYALKAVAAKMDRDEDVLLLHLTTHGGSNHVLVLGHPQLELYGLSPRYLKALIDQSGIRYRVVVVSACYSGAFVQPLANPNALVITAASANRQSFGCGKKSPDHRVLESVLSRSAEADAVIPSCRARRDAHRPRDRAGAGPQAFVSADATRRCGRGTAEEPRAAARERKRALSGRKHLLRRRGLVVRCRSRAHAGNRLRAGALLGVRPSVGELVDAFRAQGRLLCARRDDRAGACRDACRT